MNLRWIAVGAAWAVILGLTPVCAASQLLPYESVEFGPLPSLDEVGAKKSGLSFPDWYPRALQRVDYVELLDPDGKELGAITCVGTQPAYITLIYYSEHGLSYLVRKGLPLPADHETTVTFVLPPNEPASMTRFTLWRYLPAEEWLELLAAEPGWQEGPIPGVLTEQWFVRAPRRTYITPWEDPFRPSPVHDDYFGLDWPLCQAELTGGLTVRAKDCALLGTTSAILAFDQWGSLGNWLLSHGAELSLVFELPPTDEYYRAHLYLYGTGEMDFWSLHSLPCEVSVNGWLLSGISSTTVTDSVQQHTLPIGPYLQAGENSISLRLNAFADAEWQLQRLEVWAD